MADEYYYNIAELSINMTPCYYLSVSTVFVAMSGGIDSSFAARLLLEQGYRVVGFTFLLLSKGMKEPDNPRACCSLTSVTRARKTAADLSIPHYVIDLREEFEHHVLEKFISEYRAGRTPNPCILCNTFVKFSSFLEKALALGADMIATGHYASIEPSPTGPCLKKAVDRAKDQTYFLYGIPKTSLESILFPLASRIKTEAVEKIRRYHSHYAGIGESQDICFIPEGDYRMFIRQFVPLKKGDIVSVEGKILGQHEGAHGYTIGQRRGLGIPFSVPLYVIRIDAESNTVVVGSKEHLQKSSLEASHLNLFADPEALPLTAKVRYRQGEKSCSCRVVADRMFVHFDTPISSITPGQSVVLYNGEMVVGGGTIDRVL